MRFGNSSGRHGILTSLKRPPVPLPVGDHDDHKLAEGEGDVGHVGPEGDHLGPHKFYARREGHEEESSVS